MNILSTSSKTIGVLLLPSLLGIGSLCAQDDGGAKGWLRLLPLGQPPPWKEKIIDGKRMQQDAPDGSVPPLKVQLPPVGKDAIPELRLKLDQMSPPVQAKIGPVPLREMDGGAALEKPWETLKMPQRPAALGLLWRTPGAKTWDEPMSLVLPDDTSAFPLGRIRMINVTPWTAAVKIGDAPPVQLKSGQKFMQAAPAGGLKQAPVMVALADTKKGGWVKIGGSFVTQSARQRTNVVVYVSDGVNPRFPASVYVRAETPIFPKKPR